jgi:hypothetical protein
MKLTSSQFKQLLKEEIKQTLSELGGLAGQLGAVAGRNEPPMEAPMEDQADSLIQDKAFVMFRNLGIKEKESMVMANTIAINDLIELMKRIPKIDTANEEGAT